MIENLVLYDNIIADECALRFEEYNQNKTNQNINALTRLLLKEGKADENMWKKHVLNMIMDSENEFSLTAEINGKIENSFLKKIVKEDLKIIRKLLLFDPYSNGKIDEPIIDSLLEGDIEQTINILAETYFRKGAGVLNKSLAYLWNMGIVNVNNVDEICFDELIGYEYQKDRIIKNTEAFINDKPYNNLLLFGDKGTGKSSMVKAVFNRYKNQGLRICEINKNNLEMINESMDFLGKRGFKFILFMDDLSFEENEYEYKALKAHIEGGLKIQPKNVAIYATSNRKHIVKESVSDNQNITDELHLSDAIQEKLSLSDRFGITITFPTPNQREYMEIIKGIVGKYNIKVEDEELRILANRWALSYHGKSGRSAKQFVDSIRGGVFND